MDNFYLLCKYKLNKLHYYDAASVVWFSILSAIILTTVLYRPLSHSIWFKPLWDKLEQESKERVK